MPVLVLLALQEPKPHGPEPGPRAAVAGLGGFHSVSKLDFGIGQNRLTADYVFPDRVRWHFEDYADRTRNEHQFLYRTGETLCEFAAGRSRAIEGADRGAALLQMELRRAAMLWPDGFDWNGDEGGAREAEVLADTCCREMPVGKLVATLRDRRPVRIEALSGAGETLEILEIRAWQEISGRTWPRTLEIKAPNGQSLFVETIETIETRVQFLELSFLPPDRRPIRNASTGPGVVAMDLVAVTYSPHPLPKEVSWEQALEKARGWIAEARESLGPLGAEVDLVPTFELSPLGRPTACLVRLTSHHVPPPDGFRSVPEGVGILCALPELLSVNEGALIRLKETVPIGLQTGTPYTRIHDRPVLPIELVVPIESSE